MAVFDGVCYSLSPSLSPSRRSELASVLDLNGAVPHSPYTHLIAPTASHAHTNATSDPAVKLVTDRWVDRSVVMGKLQPEQYYSPDPAMIFSGVVACATDLSAADLEVLSAGITALGGQWRVGLTRDVTHLFALRAGSDKYNTALHFAPQTNMCILTPHWFDDAVRLGRRIPETPYAWPDPPVLRPGITLNLDDDTVATEGRRRRRPPVDADAEAADGLNVPNQGEQVRVWAGRRILLSTSLELTDGSRRAIETRIERAGGIIVRISEDEDEDAEEKAVDDSDVFVTRWRCGKAYFKAARASLLIGTLSWLFSVESSGTLHSPFDSLLWYPTPRGGILGLIDCEISITNYTGASRDYLKRLITLVGAKFTPSMSQSNKVLIAGFQPSPKTTRALSWSIPVVNHTWLEDCFVEWRSLTVALERYIVYPPGVDFGKILLSQHNGVPSSQSLPAQRSSGGGAVPGGRGIGPIDLELEETRDLEYRIRAHEGGCLTGLSISHEAATTADGLSMALSDVELLTESRVRPRSRAGSVKKTPSSALVKRGSMSTPITASATGAFVDHVIELPVDNDDVGSKRRTPKQRQRTTSLGPTTPRSVSRQSSVGLFSTTRKVEVVVPTSGGSMKGKHEKDKGKGKGKSDVGKRETRPAVEVDEDQPVKPGSRPAPRRADAWTDDEMEKQAPIGMNEQPRRRIAKRMTIGSDLDSEGEEVEDSVPPRRPAGTASLTPVKSGMKPRPRSKSQSRPRSVLYGESEEEVRVLAAESWNTKAVGKRRQDSVNAIRNAAENEQMNKEKKEETKMVVPRPRIPTRSPSPTSPVTKNSRAPKRRLSVLVPSVPKRYVSPRRLREVEDDNNHKCETGEKDADVGATSAVKRKRFVPGASMHAIATEASASTSKRGRPSPAKISAPITVSGKSKPQPRAKVEPKPDGAKKITRRRADDDEDMGEEEEDNDTSMIVDSPVASTSRGGPRRSAANKATTRLRKEIMPDVVNFEREQKQAKRRRSGGGASVASEREEEIEGRVGKKRKVSEEVEEEVEEEAEVEDVVRAPSVKAKPTNGKGKAKKTTVVGSDNEGEGGTNNSLAKSKHSEPQERKGDRGRGKELACVRLMTTCVTLSDDVIKRLTKLGVQMTTKPTDCTHLVAKGIVRTEKFLCAMPLSPWILTEEWANASAKSGKLLPENGYLLSDAAAEEKWVFNFVDAVARAKGPEGGSNLFKQMTFYVTPKVSVDTKMLKNVVSAGGGQVQTSTTPTLRILRGKPNRFVVSSPEDKAIWRPLAQEGFKIYSPELVLRGALKQEIEWDNEECLVAGS